MLILIFTILSIVVIWKWKMKFFIWFFGLMVVYFLFFNFLPSKDCGHYHPFYPEIQLEKECNCNGIKKNEIITANIKCIGRVNGWE